MRYSRNRLQSRSVVLLNRLIYLVGGLLLFAGIGGLLFTFGDLYVLLKQAKLIEAELLRLLPIFLGGVVSLVIGVLLIKSAKAVLDRPF
jgi:hypothetical protein